MTAARARALALASVAVLALTGCATTAPSPASAVRAAGGTTDTDGTWHVDGTWHTGLTGSIWVADEGGDSLTVLDAGDGSRAMLLTGIAAPHNVQASLTGDAVWAVSGADLLVSLGPDGTVTGTAPTDAHPAHVVTDDAGRVLVTASDGGSVSAYDHRLQRRQRVVVGGGPHGMRLAPDGRTAVVANTAAGTVDVVDLSAGEVRVRVPVGERPVQVAVSPDGRWAWASVAATNEVVRLDVDAGVVTHRTTVPAAPAQVLLTGAGQLLVADQGTADRPGRTVSVLEPDALQLVSRLQVGSGPHGLAAEPAGRFAWVTHVHDHTVSTLDLRRGVVLGTVDVGRAPNGITFSPRAATGADADLGLPSAAAHDGHGDDGPDGHDHGDGSHEHDGWWP